jgi:hypothetical protein
MESLASQKKNVGLRVTSKPKNQKNVTAILSRASREATGPRPVPDVAASNHIIQAEKKSD